MYLKGRFLFEKREKSFFLFWSWFVVKDRLVDLSFIEKQIISIAKQENVFFMSKADLVCPIGQCSFHTNKMFNYSDTNHWSESGLSRYGELMTKSSVFKDFLKGDPAFESGYSSWYAENRSGPQN